MALLPIVCTADVEAGSDLVEVTGTDASTGAAVVLTDINCRPNATVFLAGAGYLVAERVDTTSFRLERDYAGADATGISCSIAPFTPEMASRAELATALRTTTALTQLLQARGNGLHYIALGSTGSGDPGAGKISYVGASWAAATALCIDVLDAVGRSRSGLLARWKLGDTLIVESIATAAYVAYELSEAPSSQETGAWYLLEAFTLVASDGALVDGEALRLVLVPGGEPGPGYESDGEVETVDALAALEATATDGLRIWVEDLGDTAYGADYDGRAGVVAWNAGTETWVLKVAFTGPRGAKGDAGWAPQLVAVTDGARRVLQLSGYVGGEGAAPTANVGDYLKADGTFTETIGEAVDVRGAAGVSYVWRSAYSGATAYAANDTVRDQGASWIALQATTGNAPPTLPTTANAYWELMAAKGADGAGTVAGVLEGTGITVDATDSTQPVVALSPGTVTTINSKITMGKAIAAALIMGG
jgi:hypothetical protein